LLIAVYFLPLFLVAVIGKGQLQNRHPKARQILRTVNGFLFTYSSLSLKIAEYGSIS